MKNFLIFIFVIIIFMAVALNTEDIDNSLEVDTSDDISYIDESENNFENILSEEFEEIIESGNTSSKEDVVNIDILDYKDATSFENDLNSGKTVNGTIVRFKVNEYKPDSAFGINTWAGEHLNFISDNELDTKADDTIIARVKEEPYKFLGSWIIKCDIIQINDIQINKIEDFIPTEEITDDSNNTNNEIIDNTETNIQENQIDEKPGNTSNIIEKIEEPKVTYNYYTTNTNEVAKKGNAGKYSYVKKNGSYKVYWIIDFEEGYVYDFTEGNGDDSCEKIKIKSGNLNDGLELSYKNSSNAWAKYIHFKYTNQPHQLIIVDNDYFEYEYSTTSLEDALKLMETKTIWQP